MPRMLTWLFCFRTYVDSVDGDPRFRACVDCGQRDVWRSVRPVVIYRDAWDRDPPSIRYRCVECLVARHGNAHAVRLTGC